MKSFEIFKKKNKNGRRKFKAVLYEVYPDSVIDEANKVGTKYNKNGITWIEKYCQEALPSIAGMSLRCEFLDEDRTELAGHGDTDVVDGLPVYEDAVVIGTFEKGYIDTISTDEGDIRVCIGEGTIDEQCYHNFCVKLDEDIANGIYPNGSVEIMHTENNDGIRYLYGYKDKGRIPTEFIHSGYALLGVTPADDKAKLIELNKKEEKNVMTQEEIKAVAVAIASEINDSNALVENCKAECEAKISEINEKLNATISEKNEIVASSQAIQEALDKLREEYEELNKQYEALYEERKVLEDALGEAKARERLGEMNSAISEFTEEERAYAKDEIEAFMANPVESEINTITSKIWEGIGKASKEAKEKEVEQNSAHNEPEDIFGEIQPTGEPEDISIF